jgi:predicted nucleic acid-binding protein
MTVVIDTNVVAYLLLGTERFVAEARRFMSGVEQGLAPALWEAELANVVWMAIQQGVMAPVEGPLRLALAARLGIRSIPSRSLWQGALVRAVSSGVAVYDTLFVELAVRERLRLATFDRKVLRAFPDVASRPGDLTPR